MEDGGRDMELGIPFGRLRAGFRLRKTIRNANRITPLGMIGAGLVLLVCSAGARATTYYVSSSKGNDLNSGSISAPWQTIAHVNGQTFQPGDSILFKRGDVWNESLTPLSSGGAGNPITFDAYGAGAAPNLTGYYAVPATAWVQVTGNAWKAPLQATYTTINFCLFGTVWGQKVAAATSNLVARGNFYLANGYVYIFSAGNPAITYSQPIVPMALSNVPVINVNGQSWLTFQHFLVNWFDEYGVYVQGSSDHLVFANMESDSMIPQGTQPLGFYLNESVQPTDIRFYDDESMFGGKPGAEKKDAAMLFLQNALSTIDAIAAREIVNPEQFQKGISEIIDGTVMCLNASSWCKQLPGANAEPSAR